MNIDFKTTFLGFCNDPEWRHFKWVVSINGVNFDYRTGIGHVEKTIKKGSSHPVTIDGVRLFVTRPNSRDVLECLFADSDAGMLYTFNNFCSEFGYDTDSRKALKTYLECQEIAEKLSKALGTVYNEIKSEVIERQ